MKTAAKLFIENADRYPEFRRYLSFVKKAESNRANQPDVCIEICKSLFEGISKSIIERLEPEATREELNKLEVGPLVKRAARALKKEDNIVEDDFVTRSVSFAYAMATLRNERGDISHGRGAPKEVSSTERLAQLALQMSEGIVAYMLDAFYALPIAKPVEAPDEIEREEESDLEELEYEENPEFNNYLDVKTPTDGKPLYSLAVYELYYEDYLLQLDEYRGQMEDANL